MLNLFVHLSGKNDMEGGVGYIAVELRFPGGGPGRAQKWPAED